MYLAWPLRDGEVLQRHAPDLDAWRCASCGALSKRAKKERDQRCLKCVDEQPE